MATSHKHSVQHLQNFILFCKSYFPISVILTFALVFIAYKDLVYLRFESGFLGEASGRSAGANQLLIDGFSNNLIGSLFNLVPVIAFALLIIMVAYSVFTTFHSTYHGLNVSKNYVNTTKTSPTQVILQYIVLSTVAFTLPVLFWCFYLTSWFPYLAKLPLRYIAQASTLDLLAASLFTLVLLIILTHAGIVMTRLAIRLFKYE